jgi:hypothetical protein
MTINYDQPLGSIDKGTRRYLSLTKAYPNRHFLCDSCGVEYQSTTFYSLAYHESELPYKRVYCENCLQAFPAGQQRCQLEINKTMNKKAINQNKKLKNSNPIRTKKTLSLPTPAKPKKTKNPSAYYECMASQSQSGLKPSLTKCCHNCKVNSQALLSQKQQTRTKEIKKITTAYQQIGISLGKILTA